MSDWHFGMDYDMWLFPPVDGTAPDYDYELPEPIEAADIEGILLINAEDAIEQVRYLQAETAKLRDQLEAKEHNAKRNLREYRRVCEENDGLRELCRDMFKEHQRIFHAVSPMRTCASSAQMAHWYDGLWKLGIEVK